MNYHAPKWFPAMDVESHLKVRDYWTTQDYWVSYPYFADDQGYMFYLPKSWIAI